MTPIATASNAGSAPSLGGRRGRALSAAELLVGAAIVVGHNVFHVIPNEVPILVVLALASIRIREGGFAAVGLGRPKSWPRTVLLAAITAFVVLAAGELVTEPLAKMIGLREHAGAAAHALGAAKGDAWAVARNLAIVWAFAAFGEEIGYRRYLLGRATDLGNRTALANCLALVAVSALFGLGHFYQGPAGVFTTACDGFVIGAAYLLTRRNLWVAVLAHGLVDTVAIVLLYFGLAN